MENKKKKLTISGSPKKSFKNLTPSKPQGKNTVVIEKKTGRSSGKSGFSKPFASRPSSPKFKQGANLKPIFLLKHSHPHLILKDENLPNKEQLKNLKEILIMIKKVN